MPNLEFISQRGLKKKQRTHYISFILYYKLDIYCFFDKLFIIREKDTEEQLNSIHL